MLDDDTFRKAGRTRRVDHIRRLFGINLRPLELFGTGGRSCRSRLFDLKTGGITVRDIRRQIIEREGGDAEIGEQRSKGAVGQNEFRRGIAEQKTEPFGRRAEINQNINAAGFRTAMTATIISTERSRTMATLVRATRNGDDATARQAGQPQG